MTMFYLLLMRQCPSRTTERLITILIETLEKNGA